MLVLTRKLEESVMIGSDVEVRVLDIHGDHVRLGFSAPRSIPVFRKEVFEAIQEENRRAASPNETGLAAIAGSFRSEAPAAAEKSCSRDGTGGVDG